LLLYISYHYILLYGVNILFIIFSKSLTLKGLLIKKLAPAAYDFLSPPYSKLPKNIIDEVILFIYLKYDISS